MRKRIAVLVAQIDETTQNRFLTEFIKKSYEHNYDICIFTMYQKFQETTLRNIGDSNIYELINYELFDAIVLLGDTILTPGLIGPLQKKIKDSFNGPVLVFDMESTDFASVIMDHYSPVRKIVDHLIDVHGYKDIAFLGGKQGHPHSVQRLNAYLDSMKAHNLPVNENWIYHGNYWYDSAEAFVDLLMQDAAHLPQAIACASDIMAIGAAAKLSEYGIKIPEDIAITGYDSINDGRLSPKPLTSADIPSGECGEYCAEWIHEALNNLPHTNFVSKAPLFVGGSCGCQYQEEFYVKKLRDQWRTQYSTKSMYSDFNHYLEDMLAQNNVQNFWQTILDYSYQIRPFFSFDICLNDSFLNPDAFIGEKALRKGYTDTIYDVLSCVSDANEQGSIDFNRSFSVKDLFPALHEEKAYPTTYIFNPLYFDDRCFGYTVINFADEIKLYDVGYRVWMRNIMQGMESFYRQCYMLSLVERLQADQIRDSLTGLYNYQGFIKNASMIARTLSDDTCKANVITIDIKGLKQINELYSREAGDKAIITASRMVQNTILDNEVCCRIGNDEFLIATFGPNCITRGEEIKDSLNQVSHVYRPIENASHTLKLNISSLMDTVNKPEDLASLINQTISIKNHKKNSTINQTNVTDKDAMDEIKYNQLVMNILDNNLLTYHYQPIINANDGTVYAYEALMRYEKERISPPQIIHSAKYMNRLSDIERFTLLNVTLDVDTHAEAFGDAKVFINSLPGLELTPEDDLIFAERLKRHNGKFVIEFTEESELNDAQLATLKEKYKRLNLEIAIDDYGAGYSNVNNLIRYKPQYVKIDRLLISEIQNNPQKKHFVKSIIDFAHDNHFLALAEGVENSEELKECIVLGADLIQGYYTGKPQKEPIREISNELRTEIERYYMQSHSWNFQF